MHSLTHFFIRRHLLSLVLFTAGLIPTAQADHAMGGEISYVYLGGGQFEITVFFYRECFENGMSGSNLDDYISLGVFEGNNTYAILTVPLDNSTTNAVDVTLENPCGNLPPNLCMQRLEYSTTVNLPASPMGYDLVFERCCRNSGIVNISNPESVGIGLTTQIPPMTDDENPNSSPLFNIYPPSGLCANFDFFLDQSATDADGDSLAYSFCTPWNGGSQDNPAPIPSPASSLGTIPWAGGFGALNPITANPGFEIDPMTGQVTGYPTQLGAFVVGICVSEYRDGELLSTVMRDFQMNVVNCDPTIISAVSPQTTDQLCIGETLEFTEQSIGAQSYIWDFGAPGNADVSTLPNPSYTFPDTGVYDVTLIVNPDWPCADTAVSTFYVYEPLDLAVSVFDYQCLGNGMEAFQLEGEGAFNVNTNIDWSFPSGSPSSAGTLITPWIEVEQGLDWTANFYATHYGCESDVDFDWIAPNAPIAGVEDQTAFCSGLDFTFTNLSTNAATFLWDFGVTNVNNDISTEENPAFSYPIYGDYTVTLIASTPFACPDTAYATVLIDPPLDPTFTGASSDCFSSHNLDLLAIGSNPAETTYTWAFGGPATSIASTPTQITGLQFDQPGDYVITLTVEANGCTELFNAPVNIVEDPTIGFEVSNPGGCPPLTVQFTNSSASETVASYLWNFGDGAQSVQTSPSHVYTIPGTYTVSLDMGTGGDCVTQLNMTHEGLIQVAEPPQAGFDITPNSVDILNPEVEIEYLGDPGMTVYYSMGDGGSLNASSGTYLFSDGGVFEVIQTVVDPSGCASTANGQVAVSGTVVYCPTAFSPNNDGINDVWLPVASGVWAYQLDVYDRWGEWIWTSTNPDEPWMGQHGNGNHFVQDGVYSWVLRLEDDLRNPKRLEGSVLLIR